MRKCRRSGKKLSLSEKILIVHQAVVLKYHHKDIAKEHRITASYVTKLQSKALKNKKFIAELMSIQDRKQNLDCQIKEVVKKMNQTDEFIDSVESLKEKLA